ncbi:hypothetical protein C8T65DRAFT_696071 [Cerioporus squamosus]|nr:hypothetical protein C8T65DRAFT_696071 [Cerioporus squamosus]
MPGTGNHGGGHRSRGKESRRPSKKQAQNKENEVSSSGAVEQSGDGHGTQDVAFKPPTRLTHVLSSGSGLAMSPPQDSLRTRHSSSPTMTLTWTISRSNSARIQKMMTMKSAVATIELDSPFEMSAAIIQPPTSGSAGPRSRMEQLRGGHIPIISSPNTTR